GRTSVPTLTNERAITEGQYYYVQVGSFIGTPKETLLAKIKNRGFKYRQVRYLKESQQASKVLIGPYPSKSQSITALNTVRTHINPDAFIVLRIE
ncbi:MAG: SPOR domain-containing protein, partial [Kiritimatiellae bacterium]|nr:SPOR domain-containing protein [Kiritimatiellia bacterium]